MSLVFYSDGRACAVLRCLAGMVLESASDALNRATERETAAAFLAES